MHEGAASITIPRVSPRHPEPIGPIGLVLAALRERKASEEYVAPGAKRRKRITRDEAAALIGVSGKLWEAWEQSRLLPNQLHLIALRHIGADVPTSLEPWTEAIELARKAHRARKPAPARARRKAR